MVKSLLQAVLCGKDTCQGCPEIQDGLFQCPIRESAFFFSVSASGPSQPFYPELGNLSASPSGPFFLDCRGAST